jgi:hypothetical protein
LYRLTYLVENGLKTLTPKLAKSFTFRVTTIMLWKQLVAAMSVE